MKFNDEILRPSVDDCDVSIVEILNRSVNVDRYDILADEIAALVSRHQTLNWDIEDVNKVVATFKPIATSQKAITT